MKFIDALELGFDCGCDTVGSAITNVEIHGMNLFVYDRMDEELLEMYNGFDAFAADGGSLNMDIEEAIVLMKR